MGEVVRRLLRWLAPRFDQPQTAETLRAWFVESGLTEVTVFKADHLTARGRKAGNGPVDAARD